MEYRKPLEKRGTYSLIVDLEGKLKPYGVTATLSLGTVIWAYGDFICIGSGEFLGGRRTIKIEETRMRIVKREDLKTIRFIFERWVQQNNILENEKELVLKGSLGTQDNISPIISTKDDETLIFVNLNNTSVQVRFIKESLQYIKGIDIQKNASLRGIEVYVCGLALLTEARKWEILGRSLLRVKE